MEILEKYQYLGLMRSGTKADMFTCLNTPTDHATAVKQATIVVHVVTHTSTYMEPHIPNIKHIDPVLDIYYPEEHILKVLTHQPHKNDPRIKVGDGSTPITKRNSRFLNNEENKKKLFSFSSTHISKAGMGGTLLLSICFMTMLSNTSALQPFRGGYSCL